MDRLFKDSFVRPAYLWAGLRNSELAIAMYQTRDDVVVKTTLPEVKPEEVDITIPKAEEVKPKQIKVKAKGVIEGKK